jgi:hypothetical protein
MTRFWSESFQHRPFGPANEEAELADPADARAGLDGRTPDPAAGELLPGAAVQVPWAALGRAAATAPATTLATATVVVTEATLARPSSRSATPLAEFVYA